MFMAVQISKAAALVIAVVLASGAPPACVDSGTSPSTTTSDSSALLQQMARISPANARGDLLPLPLSAVSIPTFFWNSHYQCSEAPAPGKCGNAKAGCSEKAAETFVSLAQAQQAQIAAAIETFPSKDSPQPYEFSQLGLNGFTQINGFCEGKYNDQLALLFADTWVVNASDGGCLFNAADDQRAFAVARVTPPAPVGDATGCDTLCVLAVHMPHGTPTEGMDKVQSVCGASVQQHCTIAIGDWNTDAAGVSGLWSALLGSSSPGPSTVEPDQNTCCYQCGAAAYDHLATNIPGASATATVLEYPILDFNPIEEHNPVSVVLSIGTESLKK